MGLGGLEQPPDGVAGARGGIQRGRVAAQPRIAVDRLRAGDREQLAAPFVQLDAQAKERLRRPPKRLRARRTPFAIALSRPRSGV